MMDSEALAIALNQSIPGLRWDWFESIGSTNQWLMQADAGVQVASTYWLVGADIQTAGRGRRQKSWASDSVDSLTFSIRLPAYTADQLPSVVSLPLALGVAVVEVLQTWLAQTGLTASGPLFLKWPNDVLCGETKVAGMLIESKGFLVVGLGLNLTMSSALRRQISVVEGAVKPGALLSNLSSLDAVLKASLVAALVAGVIRADKAHREHGFPIVREQWLALSAYQDQAVTLMEAGQPVLSGQAVGIGDHGELLVLDDSGVVHTVLSGDLSLRLQAS
jgi:BirA family transcriptional regulator, biotin operon repressor / biotin---[acetyl-CoA-carboxylase] ligase